MTHLARLLVRIARRIDGTSVSPAGMASPTYIEDLRRHYPGAPLHWLEALARRGIILGETAPSHQAKFEAVVPDPPQRTNGLILPVFDYAKAIRKHGPAVPRTEAVAERPKLRLGYPARSPRPMLDLPTWTKGTAAGELKERARVDRLRSRRAGLRFVEVAPDAAASPLNVRTASPRHREDPFGEPEEHQQVFAQPSFPGMEGCDERPLPRFESAARPPRMQRTSPNISSSSHPSLEQDFRELLSRWPALPLFESAPPIVSKGSPIEISVEQVIGTWSA